MTNIHSEILVTVDAALSKLDKHVKTTFSSSSNKIFSDQKDKLVRQGVIDKIIGFFFRQ